MKKVLRDERMRMRKVFGVNIVHFFSLTIFRQEEEDHRVSEHGKDGGGR